MPGVSDPQTLNWTAGLSRMQEGVAGFPVKQVDVFRFDRNGDRPNAIFNTNRSSNQEPGIRVGEHVGDCPVLSTSDTGSVISFPVSPCPTIRCSGRSPTVTF